MRVITESKGYNAELHCNKKDKKQGWEKKRYRKKRYVIYKNKAINAFIIWTHVIIWNTMYHETFVDAQSLYNYFKVKNNTIIKDKNLNSMLLHDMLLKE